ncbi:hypothetical protein I6E81_00865 [Salinibacterium sp. NG22]|uniref:hypothetical protein n=1 Tax=Salinibacterium sp. NG22 TaxID=2792040 RepID=UPI0018CE8DAD|nr:hypothetical protein [Salinibacterium sp. NG22]MBH0108715.1 hypothetical protein [Salinibacterium sp. NG22]
MSTTKAAPRYDCCGPRRIHFGGAHTRLGTRMPRRLLPHRGPAGVRSTAHVTVRRLAHAMAGDGGSTLLSQAAGLPE